MTATSDKIKKLIAVSWTDWVVTVDKQKMIVDLLRNDLSIDASILALHNDGMTGVLVQRIFDANLKHELVQLLGGQLYKPTAYSTVGPTISTIQINNLNMPYFSWNNMFDICNHLLWFLKRNGIKFSASVAPNPSINGPTPETPFSGSGATGVNPTKLDIPIFDQIALAAKHSSTTALYRNPLGSLTTYLASLTKTQISGQVGNLTRQPVSSVCKYAYANRLPTRADVMRLAGKIYRLHPALIAGFILAEQRDQSRNEDAADFMAATSIKSANTSIGLGQVVVSTARNNNLFSDLLPTSLGPNLSHKQVATLLASDEFNIFAVAKYLRKVADAAASISPANLAKTKSSYPRINMHLYALDSSSWPDDNVKALGSEYTSKAWDGKIFPHWGDFVFKAYQHVRGTGIF